MCSFCNSTIMIGISGVTCGGKTTLANAVQQAFPQHTVTCLSQDDYFFKEDDSRHTWIKELNHINFDILSSLDMKKMEEDVANIVENGKRIGQTIKKKISTKTMSIERAITSSRKGFMSNNSQLINLTTELLDQKSLKLLIVEGFCLFNYLPIAALCDLKFYFTLSKHECRKRRDTRVYDPPDCPGYFERCAWPEHLVQLEEVKKTIKDVVYINEDCKDILREVLLCLYKKL